MSHHAHVEGRSAIDAREQTGRGRVGYAPAALLSALAKLDHEHQNKLERLRLSRMPMIWQNEIAETLYQEHDAKRAVFVQRLRKLDEEVSANAAMT